MSVVGVILVRIFPHLDQHNSEYGHFTQWLLDFVLIGQYPLNLFQHSFWDFLCAKIIQVKFPLSEQSGDKRNDRIHTFLNISLPWCSKYGIRALKMIKLWEYQNTFSSDLSSFTYSRYWNDILFFTNCSDLSFLILSKSGVPSSLFASRLALNSGLYIFDLLPFLKYEL